MIVYSNNQRTLALAAHHHKRQAGTPRHPRRLLEAAPGERRQLGPPLPSILQISLGNSSFITGPGGPGGPGGLGGGGRVLSSVFILDICLLWSK